jgi:hypothetical protein
VSSPAISANTGNGLPPSAPIKPKLLDQIVNGAAAQAGPVMDVARAALSGIGDAISFMLPGLQALLGGLMDLGSNIGGLVVTALSQISGWKNASKSAYAFYGNDVMSLADKFQSQIDILGG